MKHLVASAAWWILGDLCISIAAITAGFALGPVLADWPTGLRVAAQLAAIVVLSLGGGYLHAVVNDRRRRPAAENMMELTLTLVLEWLRRRQDDARSP